MTDFNRRETDDVGHVGHTINKMIEEEDDSKQRGLLVMMGEMTKNLQANTQSTIANTKLMETHIAEFKAHIVNFDKHSMQHETIMAQAGVWKKVGIAAWSIIAVSAPLLYMAGSSSWEQLAGRVGMSEIRIQKIEDASRAVKKVNPKK